MGQWDATWTGQVGSTVQGVLRDGAEEDGTAKIMSPKEPWTILYSSKGLKGEKEMVRWAFC